MQKVRKLSTIRSVSEEANLSSLFRVALWVAFGFSLSFLFLSVVSAPLTLSALSGFTGGHAIKLWSVICGVAGLALALVYSDADTGSRIRGYCTVQDVWSLFVILLAFLCFVNYFVQVIYTWSPRGLMAEHDAPQYYMQLHSFTFDQDASYHNEYELLPRGDCRHGQMAASGHR